MKQAFYQIGVFSLAIIISLVIITCSSDKATNDSPEDTIIATHLACADFDNIPEALVDSIQTNMKIFYMHTSHGSQVLSGMYLLRDEFSLYDFNMGDGSLSITEYGDDLGTEDDTSWAPITRQYLDDPDNGINVVAWSWCGGVSANTEEGINIYLNIVNQLEQDYPNVTFIYMTGHLDGTGADGNLYTRNNQIRAYCEAHGKYLFDFADIESYDPAGNYYADASDACEWCDDWCEAFDCPECDCAHSHCFNCYQKGKAFWWLLAHIAGADASWDWEG